MLTLLNDPLGQNLDSLFIIKLFQITVQKLNRNCDIVQGHSSVSCNVLELPKNLYQVPQFQQF